jgi:hypothetical protein
VMQDALALYDRMGFERAIPHTENPTKDAIFIRIKL